MIRAMILALEPLTLHRRESKRGIDRVQPPAHHSTSGEQVGGPPAPAASRAVGTAAVRGQGSTGSSAEPTLGVRALGAILVRSQSAYWEFRFQRVWLKQTLNSEGWELSYPYNCIGSLPESLTQGLLVGKLLIGGLGVAPGWIAQAAPTGLSESLRFRADLVRLAYDW